jgi:hypothetical protein
MYGYAMGMDIMMMYCGHQSPSQATGVKMITTEMPSAE